MKARIKKTGEIVNIASYAKITLEACDSWGNPIEVSPEEIELIDDTQLNPEEEQLKHLETIRQQAAIAAMQGLISAPLIEGVNPNPSVEEITGLAVKFADILVKKLRGE